MTEATEVAVQAEDAEVSAMRAMVKFLDPLSRSACQRVIKWAEGRYGREWFDGVDAEAFKGLCEGIAEAAKNIDGMSGHDLLIAAREIARIRDEATTGSGPQAAATEVDTPLAEKMMGQ